MPLDSRIPLLSQAPDIGAAFARGEERLRMRKLAPVLQRIKENQAQQGALQIEEIQQQQEMRKFMVMGQLASSLLETNDRAARQEVLRSAVPALKSIGLSNQEIQSIPIGQEENAKLRQMADIAKRLGPPEEFAPVGTPVITQDEQGGLQSNIMVRQGDDLSIRSIPVPGMPTERSTGLTAPERVEQKAAEAGATTQATAGVNLEMQPLITAAVERAKMRAQDEGGARLRIQRADTTIQEIDSVVGVIQTARSLISGNTTGVTGVAMARVPGSDAFELARHIDTLQANLSFQRLQQMRDSSPTGGSLGAISQRELDLLGSAVASLHQGLDGKALTDAFLKIERHYGNWRKAVMDARARDVEMHGETVTTKRIRYDAEGNVIAD